MANDSYTRLQEKLAETEDTLEKALRVIKEPTDKAAQRLLTKALENKRYKGVDLAAAQVLQSLGAKTRANRALTKQALFPKKG